MEITAYHPGCGEELECDTSNDGWALGAEERAIARGSHRTPSMMRRGGAMMDELERAGAGAGASRARVIACQS